MLYKDLGCIANVVSNYTNFSIFHVCINSVLSVVLLYYVVYYPFLVVVIVHMYSRPAWVVLHSRQCKHSRVTFLLICYTCRLLRMFCNLMQPDAAQSLSTLSLSPVPSLKSLSLSVAVLERIYCWQVMYAVTLTFDLWPWTFVVCRLWRGQTLYEFERNRAIRGWVIAVWYLTFWPWTCITWYAMLWDSLRKV